ncbi:MAG: FKBP-type peptidyl-prolyl cis-trans isomerase [Pseudomonadales bacterium]|nr:FKBP-type peptidyl-prolyl cis-trans isomerase [Pseudomonadales bacterium]
METIAIKNWPGISTLMISALLLSLAGGAAAQDDIDLENEDNRIGYSMGANVGKNLNDQQIFDSIGLNSFIAGLLDAVAGTVQLSDEELLAAIQLYQQRAQERAAAALSDNLTASEEFLRQNTDKEGVVSLDSGLQYLILASGPADGASPEVDEAVLAHYHGTLTDGTVFDSSVDRGEPAQFGLSQVISGWTEALQLMKVGDKWRLFIPPAMAYGTSSPTPAIPPNSALIFDVELLEIR